MKQSKYRECQNCKFKFKLSNLVLHLKRNYGKCPPVTEALNITCPRCLSHNIAQISKKQMEDKKLWMQ
jgi:Zn finger protein HypA/HybF involved in hydrogenase expression